MIELTYEWNTAAAGDEFARAIALNPNYAIAHDGVVSEKSIVLSWAVLTWSVQSDRLGDVSVFGLLINSPARQSASRPDCIGASSGATLHGSLCPPGQRSE